ncbi:retrovirus-related pol polyprotein from transposon 17.6 [Plakobranchus ocellatus]|uniref:Retrovirus-related pol polyprotein from transposon 17.6 n=1 Tax=Plakobranchus ocellatus TaxID=259542 RepID=A0AAV4DTN6_9GAST|nr:retrovirus-related pol polyprotein from transposon 17.6 [Plakobranchus ocellatus]
MKRIEEVRETSLDKKDLKSELRGVFQELGCLPRKYHIEVDPSARPFHNQARKNPIALKDRVKAELNKMEKCMLLRGKKSTGLGKSHSCYCKPK